MQTIKTGVVIVLLVAVCYGAFVALNAPEADIPEDLQKWANSTDMDELLNIEMPTSNAGPTFDLSSIQPITAAGATAGLVPPSAELPNLPGFDFGPQSTAAGGGQPSLSDTEIPAFPSIPDSLTTAEKNPPAAATAPEAATSVSPPVYTGNASTTPATDGPSVPFKTASEIKPSGNAPEGQLISTTLVPPLPSLSNESAAPRADVSSAEESTSRGPQTPALPFEIAREQALLKAKSGALKEALELLSPYYESPELGHAEHTDLVDILDALSREIIYSKRHLLVPAYEVGTSETIASVAEKHQIAPELLSAINGLGDSKVLIAGTKLKVVQGPFRATVSLSRGELTLFLGNLYAGRFPISLGTENIPRPGGFEIVDRRRDRTYYGPSGEPLPASDPTNPFGGYWLSLGDNLAIHGSPEMARSDLREAGCISLAPLDAADVYKILTTHSQVEIRR